MHVEAAEPIDLTSLPVGVTALIERLQQQTRADAQELARHSREIALARVKIDKLNIELARLMRWKFDAKTETRPAAPGPERRFSLNPAVTPLRSASAAAWEAR